MPHGVAMFAGFGALVGGTAAYGVVGTWGAAAFWALQGAALGSAMGAIINPPRQPGLKSPAYEFAQDRNVIASGLPIPIVYGRNKVWGNIFRQELDKTSQCLKCWVGLGEGPIDGVDEIRINNKLLNNITETYNLDGYIVGYRQINFPDDQLPYKHSYMNSLKGGRITFLNGPNAGLTRLIYQSGIIALSSPRINWVRVEPAITLPETCDEFRIDIYKYTVYPGDGTSPEHKNLAYLYLEASPSQYVRSTAIEISCFVSGRKVWTPSGTIYTTNPAWCLWDFIINTRFGAAIPQSRLNQASFTSAASYYNEMVDGQKRYELNYIVDAKKPAMDHLLAMLASCNSMLCEIEGEYYLMPQKTEIPIQVFTNDNCLDIEYLPEGSDRRVNQIKAKFTESPYIADNQTGLNPQAAGAKTITLHLTASSLDDAYKGMVIEILSGPGIGEIKDIVEYVGSTRVATTDEKWLTQPTTSSTYEIRQGNFEIISAVIDDEINQNEDNDIVCEEIELLGCNTFEQTARLAQILLDGITLGNGLVKFKAGLSSVHCYPGNVVEISSSRYGWGSGCTQQATCGNALCSGTYTECVEIYGATPYYQGEGLPFRIIRIDEIQEGRKLEIIAKREHSSIYHDKYAGKQEGRAAWWQNPLVAPQPCTDLIVTDAGEREPDGKWRKAIDISFMPPADYFYEKALISISYDGGFIYEEIYRSIDATCKIFPKKDAARAGVAEGTSTKVKLVDSDILNKVNDFYIGATLIITDGTNAGEVRIITDSGNGWVEWSEPMPASLDATSEYTITEYYIMIQSMNKNGLLCPAADSPIISLILATSPLNLIRNTIFEIIDTIKPMNSLQSYLTDGPGTGWGHASLSAFVDFGDSHRGLYLAFIRRTSFGDKICINGTLIYTAAWNSCYCCSLHSYRNDKAYIALAENATLKLVEIDCSANPWTIGSPVTIDPTTGDFLYPQIFMLDATNFLCVCTKEGDDDIILYKSSITGTIAGYVTIDNAKYPDLIVDGSNVYISFLRADGGNWKVYLQKATTTPSLSGNPIHLFTINSFNGLFNFPHIEKLNDKLYFIYAQNKNEGPSADDTILIASTSLDGRLVDEPYVRYEEIIEPEYSRPGGIESVDHFVGGAGISAPDTLRACFAQAQILYGSLPAQQAYFVYTQILKRVSLSGKEIPILYNALI